MHVADETQIVPFWFCRKRDPRKKQMKRKSKCKKVRNEPLCAKRCLKIQAVKTQFRSLVMCEQELPKFVAHACTVLGAAGCEGLTTQEVNARASVMSFSKTVHQSWGVVRVMCKIAGVERWIKPHPIPKRVSKRSMPGHKLDKEHFSVPEIRRLWAPRVKKHKETGR